MLVLVLVLRRLLRLLVLELIDMCVRMVRWMLMMHRVLVLLVLLLLVLLLLLVVVVTPSKAGALEMEKEKEARTSGKVEHDGLAEKGQRRLVFGSLSKEEDEEKRFALM
uniref:Uncharacterized protein n=1 Tax=Anopheles atroparvus TaxID=41427 RepID=A0A182IQ77_ANOAO